MSDDIKNTLDSLNSTFEQFKQANDDRLKQIESKGSADTLTEGKVNAINSAISDLQSKFVEIEKKAGRPDAGELAETNDEYRKSFEGYLRKGRNIADLEAKAVNTATGADGGYALPEVINSTIAQKLVEVSPMRGLATVISVSTSDYKHLVNAKGLASGWVGEASARPETGTPALIEHAIPMGELYANPASTQAALDDLSFNVEAMLSNDTVEEFARAEGAAFVSGNGSNKPSGFLNNVPTTTGSDAVLQYIAGGHATLLNNADKVIELFYKLKSAYRTEASWTANSAVQSVIRQMKTTDGQYIYGFHEGIATILGRPVVEVADMPGIEANSFPLAFGNFKAAYVIADRIGVRTLRDNLTNKPYVHFYSTKRVGGKLILPEAIKVLKISVS